MISGAQAGTAGLGLAPSRRKPGSTADERAKVLRVFESITEHEKHVHSLSLEHFAEWVFKWDKMLCSEPQWACLEKMICFVATLLLLNMCYQPPSVLECWNKITDATCHLCLHANETLRHILYGCQTALGQGRQTWRHNSILLAPYQHFRLMRNRGAAVFKSKRKPKVAKSSFISKGQQARHC